MFTEIALTTLLIAVLILGYMIIIELKSLRFNSKEIANRLEKVVLDGIAHLSEEMRQQRHRLEDIWHLNEEQMDRLDNIRHLNEEQMDRLDNIRHLNEEQMDRLVDIGHLSEEQRHRLNALSDFYSIKY